MPASEPLKKTSSKLSYTTEDIMTTYHSIMTKKNRGDLYYEDYDGIDKMKIAVTKQLLQYTGMTSYLKSINVYDNLVYFDDYNECKAALDEGDVDGLISNVMDQTSDMKILSKFSVTHNYIVMKNNNPYYKDVNKALTDLKLAEPTFQSDLNEKYYPDRVYTPLGKYEINYLKNNKTLNVATYSDYRPISYYDKKKHKYKGIAIDLMNEVAKNLGIKFNYFAIDTENPYDMLENTKTDIVMPVYVDNIMFYKKYLITKSLFDSDINYITKSSYGELDSSAKVAVVKKYKYVYDCVKKKTQYNIVEYDTIEDACDGLNNGDVSAFATGAYVAKSILQSPRYKQFDIKEFNTVSLPFGLAIRNNSILESALNKGIDMVTDDEQKNTISRDTAYNWSELSLYDKFYSYSDIIAFISLVFIFSLIAISMYINNRNRYIAQIQQKSEEAIKANNAKTDFLSRMSHEIRTPMNAILGMAAIGQSSDDINKKNECIDQIIDSGNFLLQIINDILDMNKIEQNKVELNEEYVDSMKFVGSIEEMLKANAKNYNVELRTDFSRYRSFLIKIDPLRTKQIYVNIINNAIKFSKSGSYVEWNMAAEDIDDTHVHIYCEIKDYGCGMSKEFQEKMFIPFEQEYNEFTNNVQGTGLGLAIVKNLVDIMGGTIKCESEPDKGTTFIIEFDREIHSIEEVEESLEQKADESILEGKNILLAEDNDINAMVAVEILKAHGMNVERAKDGQEAVDKYLQSEPKQYDLILMDVRMPKLDGMQATEMIRKSSHEGAKKIPIVAMTADAFDEDIKR
ncbi:transporter substrate-binding domain-containing protein, partial [Eubacterium sp. MSJ-13]|uniref:ATP-binding protein n=1 Tax=Eubacterium sp. MSJ-13 TaxID=2841513 RepID=UPI001C11F511|nr:transporter substrate-binding domain-containing protein [Eubacterium sp. MSJ-13]